MARQQALEHEPGTTQSQSAPLDGRDGATEPRLRDEVEALLAVVGRCRRPVVYRVPFLGNSSLRACLECGRVWHPVTGADAWDHDSAPLAGEHEIAAVRVLLRDLLTRLPQ